MEFSNKKSHRDTNGIAYYFGEDLEGIKKACKLQSIIRDEILSAAKPGTTTKKLDSLSIKLISEAGAEPLFLGYGGFPGSICASVNEQVVHGVPNKNKLKIGDLLTVDLGIKFNGYCGDSCRSIIIGNKTKKSTDILMIETSEKAFKSGLGKAIIGNTIGDIGKAILTEILKPKDSKGNSLFNTHENFMGHGIGLELHEKPHVPNFGFEGRGHVIKKGMCICIEPVLVYSNSKIVHTDTFTAVSSNGKSGCHYENQIYISKNGPIILT